MVLLSQDSDVTLSLVTERLVFWGSDGRESMVEYTVTLEIALDLHNN